MKAPTDVDSTPHSAAVEYAVAAERSVIEYEIKKSRFIGWACPAEDRSDAMEVLEQAKAQYPDARHHCWAYLIGSPRSPKTVAMSDDGEPSGTAGKPILNVLQHKDIGNVMLVVIRYFGGIKLGAGGLVRSYSQAAQMAMESLPVSRYVPMMKLEIHCDFSQEHGIRHWFSSHEGQIDEISYGSDVLIRVSVALNFAAELKEFADNQQFQLNAL